MSFLAPARRAAASLPRQPLLTRNYARMTLIGTLVQDAKLLNENVEGKEPIVALKIATQDPISRAAREAGRERESRSRVAPRREAAADKSLVERLTATASFHDILSFNPNLRPYLSGFRKGCVEPHRLEYRR